jgi:hypothetical protein
MSLVQHFDTLAERIGADRIAATSIYATRATVLISNSSGAGDVPPAANPAGVTIVLQQLPR